jgi:hypothetical protein
MSDVERLVEPTTEGPATEPVLVPDVDMRKSDTEPHPEAVRREEAAADEARSKRLRWIGGCVGVGMSVAGFVGGMLMIVFERGPVLYGVGMQAGSFLAALVASNVVPYSRLHDTVVAWRKK